MKTAVALALMAAVTSSAQETPRRPRITGISHIALFTKDLDRARDFYTGFLGLAEAFSLPKPDGTGTAMSFIKVNDRQFIELFPETAANSDRLNHISVEVDDAEAMRRYLAAKGFKVPDKVPLGRIKNLNFTIRDPDGHGVEFVQYMPEGRTMQDRGNHLPERVSTRMSHVGILVGSLDPALRFYRDVLGFVETWRGSRDGKVLNWVNMRVTDGEDYIELMLYDQIPAPTARGSAHHLCLEVPDVARAKAWLEARPAAKSYTRPLEVRTGINRKRQMNIFDPDGTRSEVMEPGTIDGKPTPPATAPPPR